ncbi:MAG: DUF1772 domain-containing protein [Hyphomicrobium sp.]|nr:DUF1772 domain-containing protein [Hyphomicrobium sp.]MBN9280164.1 DUF1772 domain-containing protein [Hyphomicrobium sp.]ODT24493.1 MAG: hypothetical protein ABS54_09580 [Hyphomicrobium sp. SCN 65-11]
MPAWFEIFTLVTATTGAGLVGGIFFAFSNFVMKALGELDAVQGADAMQRINVTVLNPLFFALFFGTGFIALIAGITTPDPWSSPGAMLSRIGAALYLFGTLGITIVFNVPLNEKLARTKLSDPDLAQTWTDYFAAWMWWNHVRTIAALLATICFALAIAL